MLVTERGGRLRLIHEGRLVSDSIGGIPPVDTRAQDGLMDLAPPPRRFSENRTIYFTSRSRQAIAAIRRRSRAHGSTARA